MAARRRDLDWMRLGLVAAAFPLGCARALAAVGGPAGAAAWLGAPALTGIQWLVPLFFAVSGASAAHALAKHGTRGYLVARVLRLFVPLASAALLAAGLSAAGLIGMEMVEETRGWFPWYLAAAFGFSFLLPPLRSAFETRGGTKLLAGLSAAAAVPGVMQAAGAFAAAAALLPLLPAPRALAAGRWGPVFFALVFLLGFLLHVDARLLGHAARQRGVSLAAAALSLAAAAAGRLLSFIPEPGAAALCGFAAWSLALALLGFGARRLTKAGEMPKLLGEASLPFSVLAQPCAGLLAAAAAAWQAPAGLKLPALVAVTFIAAAALYAAARRVTVLRFFVGLAPLQADAQGGSS